MNCVLFAKMNQVFSFKKIKLKKYWKNGKKYWKSQGILSVRKSGIPVLMYLDPGQKSQGGKFENVGGVRECCQIQEC